MARHLRGDGVVMEEVVCGTACSLDAGFRHARHSAAPPAGERPRE
jgi:hypothetical protein